MRGRASTRTARAGRSSGGQGTSWSSCSRSIGWRREDVFITNVVKCRPPDNRDPQPDEIAACAPYLRRQLEVLDPAVVVTAGQVLDGHVHAGRAHLAGARHGPPGRSRRRAPRRARSSRCITRRPRSGRRPSNARATPTSPRAGHAHRVTRPARRRPGCGTAPEPEPIAPAPNQNPSPSSTPRLAPSPTSDDATPQLTLF